MCASFLIGEIRLSQMVQLGYDNKHGFTVRLHKSAHLECVGTFMSHSTNVIYEVESESKFL